MYVSLAKCYLGMIKCEKAWEGVDCGLEKSLSVSHGKVKHYRIAQASGAVRRHKGITLH